MIRNIDTIRYLEFRKLEQELNLVVSSKLGPSETGPTIYQEVSNDASNVVQIHLTQCIKSRDCVPVTGCFGTLYVKKLLVSKCSSEAPEA